MIPLCAPYIRNQELNRIKECVDTEWVSYAGKYVTQFEKDLCEKTGSSHAAVTISGTASLHLALIISGVTRDDEVILPALSFVAPANAIRYCGAWPTFVDVSMNDWQMDMNQVSDFLTESCERNSDGDLINRHTGRRVAAIMPVHLLGGMADLDALLQLAHRFNLPVIEDAAECLGATWRGHGIGATIPGTPQVKRITCTSFNGNKIMTTGGGGALLTNCLETAKLARHLSTTAKTNDVEFVHDQLGYNYRLSNMAAALGVGQLEQLDYFLKKKQEIAIRYQQELSDLNLVEATHPTSEHVANSYWLYTILLKNNSRALLQYLAKHDIQSRPLWTALCDLPYLKDCHVHSAENTHSLVERALSIPCSVGLAESDQTAVIHAIKQFTEQ